MAAIGAFVMLLFIVPASLSCSLPFVSVETQPDGYLVGKELKKCLLKCHNGLHWQKSIGFVLNVDSVNRFFLKRTKST